MFPIAFPFLKNMTKIEHAFYLERKPSSEVLSFADISDLKWQKPVELRQVHGSKIFKIDEVPSKNFSGDGLITNKDIPIAISVADCAPVFLVDKSGRGIGLLHCGWKSISKNILEKGLAMLKKHYGIEASDLTAFIGPSILHADYEIGEEISHYFNTLNIVRSNGNLFLDIPGEIVTRLEALDVDAENIAYFPVSTYSDNALTSYRREGQGVGRMVAVMRLLESNEEENIA